MDILSLIKAEMMEMKYTPPSRQEVASETTYYMKCSPLFHRLFMENLTSSFAGLSVGEEGDLISRVFFPFVGFLNITIIPEQGYKISKHA